jgi:hypothetical protein
MYSYPRNVKRVGVTWGISGDVCHICMLCSSVGTLTTTVSTRFARTDYRDECDCHRLYVRLIYWANFSFGEERIRPACCVVLHMHMHDWGEL